LQVESCRLQVWRDRNAQLATFNLQLVTLSHFGMSTGQACRACLLNSACLRASGASPRHSAIPTGRRRREESHFDSRPIAVARNWSLVTSTPTNGAARVAQREPAALYPASH
jgi:phage tail tape-measure protein